MTIREAIDRTDTLKPNQYPDELKIQWLSELDNRIYNDLFLTHEDNPYETPTTPSDVPNLNTPLEDSDDEETPTLSFPYTDDSVTLLAESPYDVLYPSYLKAKIDELNEETTRYANSAATYNSQYQDYARWYNRTHMPIQTRRPRCICHL